MKGGSVIGCLCVLAVFTNEWELYRVADFPDQETIRLRIDPSTGEVGRIKGVPRAEGSCDAISCRYIRVPCPAGDPGVGGDGRFERRSTCCTSRVGCPL